jgi:hypothetical protein
VERVSVSSRKHHENDGKAVRVDAQKTDTHVTSDINMNNVAGRKRERKTFAVP